MVSIDGLSGISGYHGPVGALLGTFWNDSNSSNAIAPPTIDFTRPGATRVTNFTPALGQVFFIGDGLTGTGQGITQTFVAPTGSTHLYFGYADALNFSGPPGNYDDNAGSNIVLVTVLVPPSIMQQPIDVMTNQGANVVFSAAAAGSPPLGYQWFFNQTNALAGATNAVLTLPGVQTSQAGLYAVVVTNMAGSVTSSNAVLTVLVPPSIVQQPIDVTTNQGANVAFTAYVAGSAPMSFQWWFNQTNLLAGAIGPKLALLDVQANRAGLYAVVVTNMAGSVTSSNALLTVLVPPSITRQPVSVTTNQRADVVFTIGAAGSPPLSYQWQFNGSSLSGATNATLTLPNVQTNQAGLYAVVVTNMAGSVTSSNAVLTVLVPPSITRQPVSVTTNQGANVVFTVGAAGSPPLSYHWQFNGSNLSGATNATLTFPNVQTNQAGLYAVVVTNMAGSVTSSNAVLTVLVPPWITRQPVSVTTNQGANVVFTVGAAGSPPLSYQWQFNGLNLSGFTDATLTLPNIQTNQAGQYAVVVTNVAGLAKSAAATLTVIPQTGAVSVSITAPTNGAGFAVGTVISVAASASEPNGSVRSLSVYDEPQGGTNLLLASVSSGNCSFLWTNAPIGTHRLTAVATDGLGSSVTSAVVQVVVTNPVAQYSPIAIVRAGPDPEIDALQSYLLDMGLGSQVFDQAGLSLNVLGGFELVIWDDVGVLTNGLTPNTVDILNGVYTSGTNLYLIGEHLLSAGANLPPSQQAEWMSLTHLGAASEGSASGTITITNSEGASNRVLYGPFGLISDFGASSGIEMATNDPSSELLAQCGGASALVIYPPTSSPGPTSVVVQDFRVLPPDAPASTNMLAALFQNSVCWLTDCQGCPDAHVTVQGTQTNDVVGVGQVMSYTLTVGAGGECPPLGVRLTNSLPAAFFFLGATNEDGSWIYDWTQQQVIFFIRSIPMGGAVDLGVTVAPMQVGTFTNDAVVRCSLGAGQERVRSMDSPLVTTVLPATNPPPRVSLRLLSPAGLELSLSGQANLVYGIDSSSDLVHWGLFTNVLGPAWTRDFLPWPGTNAPRQFYRGWTPH